MKKARYITNPYIYLLLVFMPLVAGVIVLAYKEVYGAIACFGFALLYFIIFIFLRKVFLSKMLINEEGFTILYIGKVIKQLKWEDVKDAKARNTSYGGIIFFSDKSLYSGKEEWKNSKEIFVRMNSKFVIYLFKYKDKIPVVIKDLNKLPKPIIDRLK